MRDAQSTETEALASRLEEHHPAYFGWALACCAGRREEAEETLQSSYLKVLEGRARFAGRSSFRTWMFGVIRLSAHEQRRRGFWNRMFGLGILGGAESAEAANPDTAAIANQTAAVVRDALAGLSARQREVLHLVFYQDLSIEGAATVLGVTVGTARTHYERGKAALRKRLGGGNNERHG